MKRGMFFLCVIASAAVSGSAIRLPEGAEVWPVEASEGRTWHQIGTMPLAFVSARRAFDLALRRQGWIRIKSVPYDLCRFKTLEVWAKGDERVLVHYWREDVSRTGFAWGILRDEVKVE